MLRIALIVASLALSLLTFSIPLAFPAEAARRDGLIRWAYYVPEDPTSLASLRQRSGDLDYVGLHWATVKDGGSVNVWSDSEVIGLVRSIGAKPLLSITAGSPDIAHAFLATEQSRAVAVASISRALADYDGVSIDFEGLYAEDRDLLTLFMAQLSASLGPAGKLVTMALSAKTSDTRTGWAGAHDYAALSPHADLFVLMAYGYRTSRSTVPGSTAPMPWVEASLSFAASQIPPDKIVLGVPLYGYDWNTTAGPPAKAMRYPDALAIANQMGVSIQQDTTQRSAYFTYTKDGDTHEVWLEDRTSLDAKLALVDQYGLAGTAAWRLGHEDPQVWPAISNRVTAVKKSWYFAEGSTARPFDTWILLQNPNSYPAVARLTFMLEDGRVVFHSVALGPTSRTSVFANQIVPDASFSTRIESDQSILAERAMYAGFDGHAVTAVTASSRIWYFAEGSTAAPFHTWILLQNPSSLAASVRVSYLLEDGNTVVQPLVLAPNSRTSIFANQVLPDAAFSVKVESDEPIIAERAMYRFPGNASTGVTGITAPSRDWFFAAGLPTFRNMPVDTWLLLQNPNSFPVTASITFLSTEGQVSTIQRTLPSTSRQSVFVNQAFSAPSFGIRVEATGEIIAERSVFMGATAFSGNEAQGAYATQGAPRLGTVWALPEGSTAPPFSETISVLNPHSEPMSVRFEFMPESGQTVIHSVDVAPRRSFDLDVSTIIRSAPVSTRVVTSLPSVAERTMFWAVAGKTGAHNTVGILLE